MYVDSHEFKLEEWSKWLEFFRLIFIAKKLYQTNKFIYSKLKKVYNDCWIKFEKLESTDLSQIGINSFLWKKIKTIQDKTKMKEKYRLNPIHNLWILLISIFFIISNFPLGCFSVYSTID